MNEYIIIMNINANLHDYEFLDIDYSNIYYNFKFLMNFYFGVYIM